MNKIYAFINEENETWKNVIAISEDGEILAHHTSTNKNWAKHDIGITSDWKHKHYNAKYPDGWEIIWIDNFEEAKENNIDFDLATELANMN